MPNKTCIPALKAVVGDWKYYICVMKYAEVVRQVGFAYELDANNELNMLIECGISKRTEGITNSVLSPVAQRSGGMGDKTLFVDRNSILTRNHSSSYFG